MAYSELIKNFDRIRDYMRQFYIAKVKSKKCLSLSRHLYPLLDATTVNKIKNCQMQLLSHLAVFSVLK